MRKGNQWHFGMKDHVGVDAETRLNALDGGHRGQRGRCEDVA